MWSELLLKLDFLRHSGRRTGRRYCMFLPSVWSPLRIHLGCQPEMVRSGFQLLRRGSRLLGQHMVMAWVTLYPKTDWPGRNSCGWSLRPWEPHHSFELRHKISTSKRTIILWGRSACLSNAQRQKIRISPILLHCMSGYHYPKGIKSSPFLSSSRSYYLCFLMANSNLELYGDRDCGYSPWDLLCETEETFERW